MSNLSFPRTLIVSASKAPELCNNASHSSEYPRTDYVELAKKIDGDIIDSNIYNDSASWLCYRAIESYMRFNFHLALTAFRRSRQYDVVLLTSESVAIPYLILCRLFKRHSAVAMICTHSSQKQADVVRRLELHKELDLVVCYTKAQYGFLSEQMRVSSDRLRCVLYAVDEEFYTPSKGDGGYVFSSGIAYRDYGTLFAAAKNIPIRFKVAAGSRYCSLKLRRSKHAIPDNVELLPLLNSMEMKEMHQNASAVVVSILPARTDAAGCSVIVEAMCCGRPVIVTQTPGLQDYVTSESTGILVSPNDEFSLSSALNKVLSDKEKSAQIGKNARVECECRLSLNTLVTGLSQAIQDAWSMHRS